MTAPASKRARRTPAKKKAAAPRTPIEKPEPPQEMTPQQAFHVLAQAAAQVPVVQATQLTILKATQVLNDHFTPNRAARRAALKP